MQGKHLLRALGLLPLVLSMLVSCTGMVQDELDETHAKLAALQALVESVNNNLQGLDAIVAHLDDSHTIAPATLQEVEGGYKISFRDGREIFIAYGKDGQDGRTLIPVGARSDEDSLYYWTVDGEWLLDAEGGKIRAGATDGSDGTDGIAPQIKVEDGFWWISHDGGQTFEQLASCEELDGVGVFSGIDTSDPSKIVLKLLDGTSIEIPRWVSMKVSFSGQPVDTVLIAAGELLPVPYEVLVEGSEAGAVTVTAGTDGIYTSRLVPGTEPGKGIAMIQAPAVFSEGYILLSAVCKGYSAIKMISFKEREITPAADTVKVRMASAADTVKVAYSANFEYTVSCDSTWIKVVRDTVARDSLIFVSEPNTTNAVRTCTVKVSPKDNPGFVCTTFAVRQASESGNTTSYDYETPDGFTWDEIDLYSIILNAPASGGEAAIWIDTNMEVTKDSKDLEWFEAKVANELGFYKLIVNVKPNDSEARATRNEKVTEGEEEKKVDERIKVKVGNVMVAIAVKQEGKATDGTGE